MKIQKLLFVIGAMSLLAACTAELHPQKASINIPGISIDNGNQGNFCPPGQAKKGRC